MFKGRGRRREDSGRHTKKKAVMKEAESGAVLPNPGSPRTPGTTRTLEVGTGGCFPGTFSWSAALLAP